MATRVNEDGPGRVSLRDDGEKGWVGVAASLTGGHHMVESARFRGYSLCMPYNIVLLFLQHVRNSRVRRITEPVSCMRVFIADESMRHLLFRT